MNVLFSLLLAVLSASRESSLAWQDWKGPVRIAGTVRDDATGQALEGVTVAAVRPAPGARAEATTDSRGEWVIAGLAAGSWTVQFAKTGYQGISISVSLRELREAEPLSVELHRTPAPPDAAALGEEQLEWADKMIAAGQFAAAREIYQRLLESNPHSARLKILLARTYAGERDSAAAARYLEAATGDDPGRPEPRLLLANVLADSNRGDDARRWCLSIEVSTLTTAVLRQQYAQLLLRLTLFPRAIDVLTTQIHEGMSPPQLRFYRALAYDGLKRSSDAKRDVEEFLRLAPADAPERAAAARLLARLK